MKIPVIGEYDHVILGASVSALKKAFCLAESGEQVAIATSNTFLAEDLCVSGSYNRPDLLQEITELPETLVLENGMLHPGTLKLFLETECQKRNIRLFYFMWKMDIQPMQDKTLVRLASKGGIFGILCRQVHDCTQKQQDLNCRAFVKREAGWSMLTVENAGIPGAGIAENLYHCRKAVMDAFYSARQEDSSLRLGRFALRGYAADGCEPAQQMQNPTKKVSVRLGSEVFWMNRYESLPVSDEWELETRNYDLVIVGGGTAGVMAAIHAARQGIRTALLEPHYELGGTGTVGGVTAYWFGTRFQDVEEIDLAVQAASERLGIQGGKHYWSDHDLFHGSIKAQVFLKKCLEAGVHVFFGQLAWGAITESGKILGVATSGEEGNVAFYGKIILDATGDGDIAVAAGADSVYGNERDCSALWPSVAYYKTPEEYGGLFSGKLMLASDPISYTDFILRTRKKEAGMLTNILFKDGVIFDYGNYVAMRESRHIKGKYTLTLRDLLMGQTYPDGLYTSYSNYDPKGSCSSDLVNIGLIPPHVSIQIPLSALQSVDTAGRRIQGLYTLGKAISATHGIFPSIRMQPDLMHQGSVMGELIAYCLKKGFTPDEADSTEVRELIKRTTGDPLQLPPKDISPIDMVYRLGQDVPKSWLNAPFTQEVTEQSVLATVLCASSEEVLPAIQERLQTEQDCEVRKLLIECALWHGADNWTEEYCRMLLNQLDAAEHTLPSRQSRIYVCVLALLPDHGIMPETVNSLNVLGYSTQSCILEVFRHVLYKLCTAERDYADRTKGHFHYIESFAFVAERTGMTAFIPMLSALLAFPEIKDPTSMPGMQDRLWILTLELSRALAALGAAEGYHRLFELVDADNTSVAYSACRILAELLDVHPCCDRTQLKEAFASQNWVERIHKLSEKIW